MIEKKCFIDFYYALNEMVLLSFNYICSQNNLLVYPFCVSLNFSIVNKNDDCLFNNLAILDDYITFVVRIFQILKLSLYI